MITGNKVYDYTNPAPNSIDFKKKTLLSKILSYKIQTQVILMPSTREFE